MKRSLSLVALVAVASFAGPFKVGGDALVGYNILSVGDSAGQMGGKVSSKPSFGFAVGPSASYSINEMFAIGAGVTFLYDINAFEEKMDMGGVSITSTTTVNSMNLGLQIAPIYKINDKISVKAGYEWDMPLGGTSETKVTASYAGISADTTISKDLRWAPSKFTDLKAKEAAVVSTHNIVLGGTYEFMPKLSAVLQAKIGLNGSGAKYNTSGDLDGAADSKKNISVYQIALGVNYGIGL